MALSDNDKKDIIEATVKGILDHLKGVLQETRSSTPGGSGLNPSMSIDPAGGTATPNSTGTVGADNPLQQPGRMMILTPYFRTPVPGCTSSTGASPGSERPPL